MDSPQLSEDGAQLLADVLKRRAEERHNTNSARRSDRRREADTLRVDPPVRDSENDDSADDAALSADESNALEPRRERRVVEYSATPEPEDDRRPFRWVVAGLFVLAVAVCAVLVFVLEPLPDENRNVESASTDVAPEVETQEADTSTSEAASEAEQAVDTPVASADPSQTGDETTTSRVATDVEPVISPLLPGDVEVQVYDTASEGEVYSFALRLKSADSISELPTDDFVVVVESEDGIAASTFTRFVHPTLPPDSSALATVRAEDTAPGEQFVTVWFGDVLVDRVTIETNG